MGARHSTRAGAAGVVVVLLTALGGGAMPAQTRPAPAAATRPRETVMTKRWTSERAGQWQEKLGPLRGCNYLPRTAVNDVEMWQEESFDPPTVDQELGWAARAGYNSLRVFLSFTVWEHHPAGFRRRFKRFLEIAHRHGLNVMPILFDDCAFSGRAPALGKQPDPVPGVHNSQWVPSPPPQLVTDRAAFGRLEAYVKDLVGGFGADPRVVVWDLYNEPGNSNMGPKSLPLAEAAFAWARQARPAQPLTIGPWEDFGSAMSRRLFELSDVISFHAYDPPDGVTAKIRRCAAYGRPLLCTEWLHRQSGNTFAAILPRFAEHRVSWHHWGLVAGRTQTYLHWGSKPGSSMPAIWQHDVFKADGSPYDPRELDLVRRFAWASPSPGR